MKENSLIVFGDELPTQPKESRTCCPGDLAGIQQIWVSAKSGGDNMLVLLWHACHILNHPMECGFREESRNNRADAWDVKKQ
jgi:hypothetical protein